MSKKISRRKFFKSTGIVLGGTTVLLYFGRNIIRRKVAETYNSIDIPSGVLNFDVDVWFEVGDDNRIILRSPKMEMGQGVLTGYAIIAADEIGIPLSRLTVEHSTSNRGPSDFLGTGGSFSTSSLYKPLRETAATLREVLRATAARKWNIKPQNIKIKDGYLSHGNDRLQFSDLKRWTDPGKVTLKNKNELELTGRKIPRIDLKDKVTAKPIYGIDQELPGMLYAALKLCPYINGKLKEYNAEEAISIPGVVDIFHLDDRIAIVANSRYAAEKGKKQLNVKWEALKMWQQEDITNLVKVGKGESLTVQKKGDMNSLLSDSQNIIKHEYSTPMASHAQIEPNGAIADYQKDKILVITGTQAIEILKLNIRKEFSVKLDDIEIVSTTMGGAFGGKAYDSVALDAIRISKRIKKPVHLLYNREEEFHNRYVRPQTHHFLQGVVDKDGKEIKGIYHQQATPDMFFNKFGLPLELTNVDIISAGHGASIPYQLHSKKAKIWNIDYPVSVGQWRSIGRFPNSFALESFMDELATELSIDPFDLRMKYLKGDDDPEIVRMKNVLLRLKEASNWSGKREDGVGYGMAIVEDRKTVCGVVAEVTIDSDKVVVKNITHVTNPSMIINRDSVLQQIEGSIMMGISACLYEKLTVNESMIEQENYDRYRVADLSDTPEMNIVLMEDNEPTLPYGIGEPPLAPVAPAIANALFNLTGKRFRNIPFSEEI